MRKAFDEPSCWGDDTRISVSHNVNLVNTLFNTVCGNIVVGAFTIFGHNCMVITGTHDISKREHDRQQYANDGHDIYIGRGVWIGSGAIILGPCMIGNHAVIAAGSVVLPGNYAGDCMYAGNPARFKKVV